MNVAKDLAALREMTAQLSDYLLSDILFWQLSGSSDFPKLSLGSYWLVRQRLSADDQHHAEIERLNQQADAVLAQWRSTAERKATGELHARLNLWQRFLGDGQGRYATEVAQRAMMALLLRHFPALASSPEAQTLAALDAALRGRTEAGPFVWAPELQPAFPEGEFWFLYRSGMKRP